MNLLSQAGAVAAVVLVMIALVVAGRRRHQRRASWIDELASVRGDGDGILTELLDDDGDTSLLPTAEPATMPVGLVLGGVTELAGRQLAGPGGEAFFEYGGGTAPVTRVGGDEHLASSDGSTLVVEISRGSVWRLARTSSLHPSRANPLLVRTAAGDVRADRADVLVTCEPDGWTYVLCFGGTVDVASDAGTATLQTSQVARLHVAGGTVQVATTGAGALDGDEVVRMHRRLDRGAVAWEPSGVGAPR